MAATVISKKKHDETVLELNNLISQLRGLREVDASTIRSLRETAKIADVTIRKQVQEIEDLKVFQAKTARKHWYQFWKPKYPY